MKGNAGVTTIGGYNGNIKERQRRHEAIKSERGRGKDIHWTNLPQGRAPQWRLRCEFDLRLQFNDEGQQRATHAQEHERISIFAGRAGFAPMHMSHLLSMYVRRESRHSVFPLGPSCVRSDARARVIGCTAGTDVPCYIHRAATMNRRFES